MSAADCKDDAAFAQAYRMAGEALEAAMRELEFVGPPNPFDSPIALVISGRIYMGHPTPLIAKRPGQRGRPPTRNQYDEALARRKHLLGVQKRRFHQLQVLPNLGRVSGRVAGMASGWMANERFVAIVEQVAADPSIQRRKQASEVERRYFRASRGNGAQPSRTAVQNALKRLRK